MPGSKAEHQRGLIVSIEIRPVEYNDDLFTLSDHCWNPQVEHIPRLDAGVTQQSIDLFDSMFIGQTSRICQTVTDGVNAKGVGLQDSESCIGQRCDSLGMIIIGKKKFEELPDRAGSELPLLLHGYPPWLEMIPNRQMETSSFIERFRFLDQFDHLRVIVQVINEGISEGIYTVHDDPYQLVSI